MAKRIDYHFDTPPRKQKRPPSNLEMSVFDRLYKHSKTTKPDVPAALLSHSRTWSAGNVVHRLMMKHQQSLAKIEKERLALDEELMNEMQDRPYISPKSVKMAELANQKELHDIMFGGPQEASQKTKIAALTPAIERKSLEPIILQAASVTAQLMRSSVRLPERTPRYSVNLQTRKSVVLRPPNADEERGKVEGLKTLRDLLATTYKQEMEEPPDMLDMNFFDRGRYWEETKRKRIAEKIEEKQTKDLKECTFRPEIVGMPSPTSFSSSQPSLESRYSKLWARSQSTNKRAINKSNKENTIVKEHLVSPPLVDAEKSKSYCQLSPTNLTFRYKTGFNELKLKKKPFIAKFSKRL